LILTHTQKSSVTANTSFFLAVGQKYPSYRARSTFQVMRATFGKFRSACGRHELQCTDWRI